MPSLAPVVDSPSRAVAAYRWSFISLGTRTGLQAISGVLIARAVSPASFGTGMLVVSVYLVASSVVLQGANGPLIVRSRVTRGVLRRVLLADMTLACLAAVALLVAGSVPSFAHARGALAVTAAGCIVLGVGGPGRALASRELAFRRTATGETAGALLGAAVAVVIASRTASAVMALPLQVVLVDLAGLVATVGLLFAPVPELPGAPGRPEPGVRYAVQTASNQLASMGSRSFPNWVVAAVLGSHALGIYSLAYRLMMLPVQNVAMVLGRVLLPRLRRMGDDIDAIEREVLAVIAAVALVVGPFSGAVLPHLDALVTVLFGSRWLAAAVPTAALLVAVFPQCCTTLASSVLASRGHGGEQLRMTLMQLLGALAATAIGSRWGVDGVAVALAVSFTGLAAVNVAMVQVRTGVPGRAFGLASLLYATCALCAAAGSRGFGLLVGARTGTAGVLAAMALGAIVGLGGGCLLLRRTAARGLGFWWSLGTSRRAAAS